MISEHFLSFIALMAAGPLSRVTPTAAAPPPRAVSIYHPGPFQRLRKGNPQDRIVTVKWNVNTSFFQGEVPSADVVLFRVQSGTGMFLPVMDIEVDIFLTDREADFPLNMIDPGRYVILITTLEPPAEYWSGVFSVV